MRYHQHLDRFSRPLLAPWNREGKICLDKNEAPFSLEDILPDFRQNSFLANARCYPDPYPLYEKLAEFLGVPVDHLLLTAGAEQGIRYAFEATVGHGDEVIYLDPSFAMIEVFAAQFNATPKKVSFAPDMLLPCESIVEAITEKTKLLVLPNPNNPTGTLYSIQQIELIAKKAEKCGTLFLLDEAYFPYGNVNGLELIQKYACLAIARTFSKAWGLAGIRVGYLISQPSNIHVFRKIKPIDELSVFSIELALLALEHPELLHKNKSQVEHWNKKFIDLDSEDTRYISNHGNFIMFRMAQKLHDLLLQRLSDQKILMKHHMDHPCMKNIIRFSVTHDDVMQRIFGILQSLES